MLVQDFTSASAPRTCQPAPGCPRVYEAADRLDGGAVLPGFTYSVRELLA